MDRHTEALKLWLANAPAVRGRDGCRSAAIDGKYLRRHDDAGLRCGHSGRQEVQDALSLSDAFIQKCKQVDAPQQSASLQYHLALEYTEQVFRLRKTTNSSALAMTVSRYVQHVPDAGAKNAWE